MNIKEHIEAGHYPLRDIKDRPVIPMRDGRKAVICATDGPDGDEIVGWYYDNSNEIGTVCSWQADGMFSSTTATLDLLPPLPRKVKVTKWGQANSSVLYNTPEEARQSAARHTSLGPVVEWTAEYEEEW